MIDNKLSQIMTKHYLDCDFDKYFTIVHDDKNKGKMFKLDEVTGEVTVFNSYEGMKLTPQQAQDLADYGEVKLNETTFYEFW